MVEVNLRPSSGFVGLIVVVFIYITFTYSGKLWPAGDLYIKPASSLDLSKEDIPSIDISRVINRQAPKDGGQLLKQDQEIQQHITDDHRIFTERPYHKIMYENAWFASPLVIWSSDFHIGPIRDLKHLLGGFGIEFIDKSLSGHCHVTNTCAKGLRVLHPGNGINLKDPLLIGSFYEAYKNDAEMESVDAFICFHPSSLCELFMPFNKSLIVIASTRYELGRHSPKRWQNWNQNLIKISKDPKNIVAANNLYDAKYIEYFTGIKTEILQSFCGYIPESYNPSRPEFLLTDVHQGQFHAIFLDQFKQAKYTKSSKVELIDVRARYPVYEFRDLTSHRGLVYVPYQVSVMSLFEQYRMNIPLFFPSLDLLCEWQLRFHVMTERTWSQTAGIITGGSPIQGVKDGIPDPNDERSMVALKYWIKYADFFQFPYIIHYSSVDDLVFKMETTNLTEVSENMKKYNAKLKTELLNKWKKILTNIYRRSSNRK